MIEKQAKVLFAGPIGPPVTGQSFAFTTVLKSFSGMALVLDTGPKGQGLVKLIYYLLSLLQSLRITLFNKYDVLYFTCSRTVAGFLRDAIVIVMSSWKGAKVINHLHGADFKLFRNSLPGLVKKIFDWVYFKVDHSIVLLPSMVDEFDLYKAKMTVSVVPNFYDPLIDTLPDNEVAKMDGEINIVYFSNLMFSKGIVDLLEAFSLVSKKYPDAQLNIAGDFIGDSYKSRSELMEMVTPFFKNEKIVYKGVVRGEKKVAFLRQADVFVLPSFYVSEAFPISILEAMRCGAVIVVSDHNYLPEIVDKKIGDVVPARNVNGLMESIVRLIENPDLIKQVQKHNVSFAKDNYGPDKYCQRVNALLEL